MSSVESIKYNFFLHFEWIFLALGMLLLAFTNPFGYSASLCLIDAAGFSFCPGCGLGTSITLFFRGELIQSFESHPAGIPAVFIITSRIGSIFYRNKQITKSQK